MLDLYKLNLHTYRPESHRFCERRDWLLPMLMNGQVTVREANEYVQEAELPMAAENKEGYGA